MLMDCHLRKKLTFLIIVTETTYLPQERTVLFATSTLLVVNTRVFCLFFMLGTFCSRCAAFKSTSLCDATDIVYQVPSNMIVRLLTIGPAQLAHGQFAHMYYLPGGENWSS